MNQSLNIKLEWNERCICKVTVYKWLNTNITAGRKKEKESSILLVARWSVRKWAVVKNVGRTRIAKVVITILILLFNTYYCISNEINIWGNVLIHKTAYIYNLLTCFPHD